VQVVEINHKQQNVIVSASMLDRNRGVIEHNATLLSCQNGALTRNCVLSEHRYANWME
jgi:hypothetical protein